MNVINKIYKTQKHCVNTEFFNIYKLLQVLKFKKKFINFSNNFNKINRKKYFKIKSFNFFCKFIDKAKAF